MEEKTEEEIEMEEENEVYDEAKIFLEEVKKIILEAVKMNKKVEYKSENLLILSLVDNLHGVFEVYNMDNDEFPQPKLVYVGDKGLRKSYLLNLINKEENRVILKEGYNR
ncbi:hypothetical protein LCGC14_1246710 [marine sediment metagenome]|uniref:Uncharacterized protein n=1 Tax=marine sediment metagenome TaxID=412755 RepID=A0A0F9LR74_9ZZZZ